METFLETDRLRLRRFTAADVDLLVELDGDPAVMRFINGGKPTPRAEIEHGLLPAILGWYERSSAYGRWAAHERSGGAFVGWFGLRPPEPRRPREVELGYRLRRVAWGQGYATEGSRALIHRAFCELGVERVFATTMTANLASRRVMEKLGMTLVRTWHQSWPELIEGTERGDVEYSVRRADWERRELTPWPRPRSSKLAEMIAAGRARPPLTYRRGGPEPVEFRGTDEELDQIIRDSR